MNLIKSDYFNTFRYKFLIGIYNIELKGIRKGEKTKVERETKRREKEKKKRKRTTTSPSPRVRCRSKNIFLFNTRDVYKYVHGENCVYYNVTPVSFF